MPPKLQLDEESLETICAYTNGGKGQFKKGYESKWLNSAGKGEYGELEFKHKYMSSSSVKIFMRDLQDPHTMLLQTLEQIFAHCKVFSGKKEMFAAKSKYGLVTLSIWEDKVLMRKMQVLKNTAYILFYCWFQDGFTLASVLQEMGNDKASLQYIKWLGDEKHLLGLISRSDVSGE
jgi:hypothetical protein